jgi:hypothetical protein
MTSLWTVRDLGNDEDRAFDMKSLYMLKELTRDTLIEDIFVPGSESGHLS